MPIIQNCTFHHLGVAVFSIEKAVQSYMDGGYEVGDVIIEPVQKVKVAYATKPGSPTIELLEPLDETSPICSILKQRGAGPYHVCYAVRDIYAAMQEMKARKFLPLAKPLPGHGLGDALTVFMYHKDVGLIQLAEMKNSDANKRQNKRNHSGSAGSKRR